jgi:hypothetical protein
MLPFHVMTHSYIRFMYACSLGDAFGIPSGSPRPIMPALLLATGCFLCFYYINTASRLAAGQEGMHEVRVTSCLPLSSSTIVYDADAVRAHSVLPRYTMRQRRCDPRPHRVRGSSPGSFGCSQRNWSG